MVAIVFQKKTQKGIECIDRSNLKPRNSWGLERLPPEVTARPGKDSLDLIPSFFRGNIGPQGAGKHGKHWRWKIPPELDTCWMVFGGRFLEITWFLCSFKVTNYQWHSLGWPRWKTDMMENMRPVSRHLYQEFIESNKTLQQTYIPM